MPKSEQKTFTAKQHRQEKHIEHGYEKKGVPDDEAKRRAWATENKISHGGKTSNTKPPH